MKQRSRYFILFQLRTEKATKITQLQFSVYTKMENRYPGFVEWERRRGGYGELSVANRTQIDELSLSTLILSAVPIAYTIRRAIEI